MQNESSVSPRINRLLAHFEELWQHPYQLSFDTLKRLITDLPEENQILGIETLAEHLVNVMKLHFLDIVATFYRKAAEEDIDEQDRAETISDVMPESFQVMQNLSKQLSVHTINELAMLANITLGLYTISEVESAEEAQRWMYKLPKIYRDRLEEEHLVVERLQFTVTISTNSTGFVVPWQEGFTLPSGDWTQYYLHPSIVSVQPFSDKQSRSLVA